MSPQSDYYHLVYRLIHTFACSRFRIPEVSFTTPSILSQKISNMIIKVYWHNAKLLIKTVSFEFFFILKKIQKVQLKSIPLTYSGGYNTFLQRIRPCQKYNSETYISVEERMNHVSLTTQLHPHLFVLVLSSGFLFDTRKMHIANVT